MLICLKRINSLTIKSNSCKKCFFSEYVVDETWFDECLLFHVITGRCDYPQRFAVSPFFQSRCCCFFVLQGVRVLYVIFSNFIIACFSYSLSLCDFSFFFIINEIFFIDERNSKLLWKHVFNNMVFMFLQVFLWRANKITDLKKFQKNILIINIITTNNT